LPDVTISLREGSFVAYTDQVLTCTDCGVDFVFSASEQEFFAQKGFSSAPKRCSSCRAQRRASGNGGGYASSSMSGGGYGASSGGGYGGGGYSRGPREMFDAVCARCGKDTQVPFRPTGARPVYCSDCFRLVRD
jgi:CxxC-x17-CxxC domain-containing protein